MKKDIRFTVGQLKQMLKAYNVPDNALVCCQSDEEGNREMVCCDMFIDQVGRKEQLPDSTYVFVGGEGVEGIDMEEDKLRYYITLRPLY